MKGGEKVLIIVIAISVIFVVLLARDCINKWNMDRKLDHAILNSKKHLAMFIIMNNWLEAKQQQKCMDTFFEEKGYHTVAIYGMHYIGERLFRELEDTQVKVLYGIDQNRNVNDYELEIYSPDDELPTVDVVIVTAPLYFYSARKLLNKKLNIPIISIAEVVEGMR